MEQVLKQRVAFREGIKNKKFLKTAKFDVGEQRLFVMAVELGYGDAKRTFAEIGTFWKDKETQRKAFFETIAEEIQRVFTDKKEGWHKNLCNTFRNELKKLGYAEVTYGQAQKVINMAFKYLFCLDGAEAHSDVFNECQMPLDSYTLAWYRKQPGALIRFDTVWSKLEEDEYRQIQEHISERLKNGCHIRIDGKEIALPQQPLYAEFIIWPEEILLKAANDFLKTLDPDHKKVNADSMQLLKGILREQLPKYCNLDVCISETN